MKKKYTDEKKENLKSLIVPKALGLFYEKGIQDVTMDRIAASCPIGVATLYRYFKTKKSLVFSCGTLLWKSKEEEFARIYEEGEKEKKDGRTVLKDLYSYFLELFEKETSFFRFLADFDSFVLKEKTEEAELNGYDAALMEIRNLFLEAVRKGQKDGSIRKDLNFDLLYYSFTKALLGLGEKLSMARDLLPSDKGSGKKEQMETMLQVTLEYLKNPEERRERT